MHELWICKHIMEIVDQCIVGKPYKRVKKIYLEIGELTSVEKSSLTFSFNVVSNETKAQGAILEIISISGKAQCSSCQKSVSINQYSDPCCYCGSFSLTVTQGEELRVKSMEVE
jgi:hydrogenase nickel incorporation protein HypA/HybF